MTEPDFVIRTRLEFDEFWTAGLELGRLRSLSYLDSLAINKGSDSGATTTPEVLWSADEPPVTPQVWWCYATSPGDEAVDLLVDPSPSFAPGEHASASPVAATSDTAMRTIREHVIDGATSLESTLLAEGFGFIALQLTYEDMVTRLLGLTSWRDLLAEAKALGRTERRRALRGFRRFESVDPSLARVGWFLHLLAICGGHLDGAPGPVGYRANSPAIRLVNRVLDHAQVPTVTRPVGRVTLNREVRSSVARSQRTVKVDATRGLFGVRCDGIRWAVVDTGIDARHEWFRRLRPDGTIWAKPFENDERVFNYTRVVEAYDFTRQRTSGAAARRAERGIREGDLPGDVPISLLLGEELYEPPSHGHGTHVAGIIGGSGGLCPDIQLFDYRVLGEDGRGNEFAVVTALRHILEKIQQARNADPTGRSRDLPIHGVNLSLSLNADVTSDACGWSLVCRVCDELVRAGVVVVVSAGNTGFEDRSGFLVSTGQDYRTVSITDPGNTDRVITVGSTDADRPREYGVSYFSARGPTADGRSKPDLVAPGNAITSSFGYRRGDDDRPNEAATLDGTSMAAAHVSGCAALLMARHRELIGKPDEVKQVLMQTATDLRRDRNFQGAGLVDALRAVQSV